MFTLQIPNPSVEMTYEVVKSKVWIEVSSFDSKKVRIENFRLESTFLKSKIFSIQNFRFEFDSKKVKWSRFESKESNRSNRIEKRNQKIEMTHTKLLTQKSQPNDSSCHGDQSQPPSVLVQTLHRLSSESVLNQYRQWSVLDILQNVICTLSVQWVQTEYRLKSVLSLYIS